MPTEVLRMMASQIKIVDLVLSIQKKGGKQGHERRARQVYRTPTDAVRECPVGRNGKEPEGGGDQYAVQADVLRQANCAVM